MNRAVWVVFIVLVMAGAAVMWRGHGDRSFPEAPEPHQSAHSALEPAKPGAGEEPQPLVEAPEPVGQAVTPAPLNEQTLESTTWGRDGFELELAPGGVLRIGGRARARWQVIGNRIRLYDRRGEEHWLDIVDDRVTWNGQEVYRVK